MLINLVIIYNTQHVVEGYDFAPDMPTELPAVARGALELGNSKPHRPASLL
jgi:hypothetical protein